MIPARSSSLGTLNGDVPASIPPSFFLPSSCFFSLSLLSVFFWLLLYLVFPFFFSPSVTNGLLSTLLLRRLAPPPNASPRALIWGPALRRDPTATFKPSGGRRFVFSRWCFLSAARRLMDVLSVI